MIDDDVLEIVFDPPDPDAAYRNNLETHGRLGAKPVSRQRAKGLMAEWSAALAAGGSVPPTKY